MPDVKDFFNEVLGTIEAEQERQAILATLTKTEKGKEVLARLNKLATDGENYNAWHKDEQNGWPVFKKAHETLASVQKELDTVKQENEKLKAGKTSAATPAASAAAQEEFDMESMTQEQLNKLLDDRIKAMGFISKNDAETIAETKAREAAAGVTNRVYTHALPLVEIKLAAKRQYEADFPGKRFDDAGFEKFMGDNPGKFPTIQDALGAFTKTDYENKTKADAFEQGRLEGEKKERERLTKEHSEMAARGLPIDMGGGSGLPTMPGAPPPEPVELEKLNADVDFDIRKDTRSGGVGQLARAVAAKMRADKAAGIRL